MKRWPTVREDTEYQTRIFTLTSRISKNPETGTEGTFYVLKCPDWVNIVAETVDGNLVMVEQYRFGTDDLSLEIPGGVVDAGEAPLEAAVRELQEETGFIPESVEKLGRVSANAAIMNNFTHMFLARGCRLHSSQSLDEHEQIRVHVLPVEDVRRKWLSGEIHHSIVAAALGLYFGNHHKNE